MKQSTVHVFVFDTLSDWEIGYAMAGINNPAFQAHPGHFRIQTVGLGTSVIHTMGGLAVVPDGSLDELDAKNSAMLILPGGITWDAGKNTEAAETARQFLDAGVPVAAICGATAGLARAGILDHQRHTSNSLGYLKATGYRGDARYEDQPAVIADNLITASGIAPLEFARCIFERLGIYSPDKLDAWNKLFKTGDLSLYAVLAK